MVRMNENFAKLSPSYLFVEIAKRVRSYQEANPTSEVIKLGIGDVTQPLPSACIKALHHATDEMASRATFRGYGPEQGYDFLRHEINEHDFAKRGVTLSDDDIFVSDGSKCDTANIQELFCAEITIAVPDPVYPVYVDTNVMAGRTGLFHNGRYEKIVYLEGNRENGFVPPPPSEHVDLLYLCFPNNPTGATATREQLEAYVSYAREHEAIILFDAAYCAFIRDPRIPHSIYEIPGANECAIEFRSFSKTAGFTGLRCAYTVVPCGIQVRDGRGTPHRLRDLWLRRHTTKFNGTAYPVQRAAEAIYSDEGQRQVRELSDYYLENARIIREGIASVGLTCSGGENSPYVWVDAGGERSWDLFDRLLTNAAVVTTPGAGFGAAGEGFIRISAFNERNAVTTAVERIMAAM